MSSQSALRAPEPTRPVVRCACGYTLFDGLVVRSRVVRVLVKGTEAKCRCKRWVALPLTYRCPGVKT